MRAPSTLASALVAGLVAGALSTVAFAREESAGQVLAATARAPHLAHGATLSSALLVGALLFIVVFVIASAALVTVLMFRRRAARGEASSHGSPDRTLQSERERVSIRWAPVHVPIADLPRALHVDAAAARPLADSTVRMPSDMLTALNVVSAEQGGPHPTALASLDFEEDEAPTLMMESPFPDAAPDAAPDSTGRRVRELDIPQAPLFPRYLAPPPVPSATADAPAPLPIHRRSSPTLILPRRASGVVAKADPTPEENALERALDYGDSRRRA